MFTSVRRRRFTPGSAPPSSAYRTASRASCAAPCCRRRRRRRVTSPITVKLTVVQQIVLIGHTLRAQKYRAGLKKRKKSAPGRALPGFVFNKVKMAQKYIWIQQATYLVLIALRTNQIFRPQPFFRPQQQGTPSKATKYVFQTLRLTITI